VREREKRSRTICSCNDRRKCARVVRANLAGNVHPVILLWRAWGSRSHLCAVRGGVAGAAGRRNRRRRGGFFLAGIARKFRRGSANRGEFSRRRFVENWRPRIWRRRGSAFSAKCSKTKRSSLFYRTTPPRIFTQSFICGRFIASCWNYLPARVDAPLTLTSFMRKRYSIRGL